jgi:hypothetical protein
MNVDRLIMELVFEEGRFLRLAMAAEEAGRAAGSDVSA